VIMAAIAAVFTIGYVANLLDEDEDWLYDLSIDMFPEDRCLDVYGGLTGRAFGKLIQRRKYRRVAEWRPEPERPLETHSRSNIAGSSLEAILLPVGLLSNQP